MFRFLSRIRGLTLKLPRKSENSAQKSPNEPCRGQHPGRDTFTICVEGNVGSGKSTLLEYLSRFPEVEAVREDLESWCSMGGQNLLHMAYRDPARWSHLLQTHIQVTMAQGHARGVSGRSKVKLMERSIHSARYCFLENLYHSGRLSQAEYLVTCSWYDQFTALTDCRVDLIVYLRTDPELALARVEQRGRAEEARVTLGLLRELHQRHEEWLVEARFPVEAPVVVVDANRDLASMLKTYRAFGASLGHLRTVLS